MSRWWLVFWIGVLGLGLGGCEPETLVAPSARPIGGITAPQVSPGTLPTATDEKLLARCMFAEALSLGSSGMCAVGCVVRNRVQSGRLEFTERGTYEDVILKHNAEGIYQFTCAKPPGNRLWRNFDNLGQLSPAEQDGRQTAFALAKKIIAGKQPAITNRATIYMTPEAASKQDWLQRGLARNVLLECYHDRGHVFFRYRQ